MNRKLKTYQFMHGKCQIFALVLHSELNLPIADFYYKTFTKKNYVHSAVYVSKDQFIDITGRTTFDKIQKYWGDDRFPETTLKYRLKGKGNVQNCFMNWARRKNFIQDAALAHRLFSRNKRRYRCRGEQKR